MPNPPESSAGLTRFLREIGALGVVSEDATLSAFFDGTLDRDALFERVRAQLETLATRGIHVPGKMRIFPLVADEWAEAWPEFFVPVAIGRRLFIGPSWLTKDASERIADARDRIVIVIEPRGFGTGHHPTTACCLAMLEDIVDRDHPSKAIDLGTGSGLLAIAAARLGVPDVLAVDTEEEAVAAAIANAERNGVSHRVRCVVADAGEIETEPAPLVLANLLTPVHLRLAPRYARLVTPGGTLVVSGITESEAPDVTGAVPREDFALGDQLTVDGWTTLAFSRTSADRAQGLIRSRS